MAVRQAWRRRARNRASVEGVGPVLGRGAAFLLALLLCAPVVRQVFLGWLDGPPDQHPAAIEALLIRSGFVVIGWIALDTYAALIRDGDRAVLGIWPVDPAEVVRFEALRVAWQKAWMPIAAGALLAPLLPLRPQLWALAVAHTAVVAALAVAASSLVLLAAVEVADSPQWRPLLDLVRGNNHPAQAAFIWAPGLVLIGAGLPAWAAAWGVARVAAGAPLGALALLAPLAVAAICWVPVARLARRTWFRAGQVMADVDARYALLEDREEALAVYADWSVRFLPPRVALYALADLRHGWRGRRAWISGAWLAGLGALAAGWSADPASVGRAALVASIGCWWAAAIGLRLDADQPAFLRAWLPPDRVERALARVYATGWWLAPTCGLAVLGSLFWHGVAGAAVVLVAGALSALVASAVATLVSRRGGLVLYGPVAAVAVALTAQGVLR